MPLSSLFVSLLLAAPVADWTHTGGFPQYPALTPDGGHVVFSDAGDLWSVPATGGTATRLTSHGANELASAVSPDGTHLAFESNRDGTTNIYVLPITVDTGRLVAAGGIRRVTTSDRAQALSGWSADGRDVLFSSSHEPATYRTPRMYAAPIDGGPVRRLSDAHGREPRISADGSTLTFTRGYAPWARPAYRGSGNRDVWAMDTATGTFRKVSDHRANDGQTFVRPDGSIALVSSRDGQNNIWLVPKDGMVRQGRQRTQFAPTDADTTIGHGVRDLHVSADGSTAAFAVWDTLYTLNLDDRDATPQAVDVARSGDLVTLDARRQSLDREVDEARLHPSGDAIAVSARGELLVRSLDEDYPAQRISPDHARQRDIAWSPDGHTLYYSTDANGAVEIHAATVTLHRGDLDASPEDDDAEDKAAEEDTKAQNDTESDDAEDASTEDGSEEEGDDAKTDTAKAKPAKNDTGAHWASALRFDTATVITGDFDARRPQPSPDGRTMLYTRDRGDLVLRDLASGEDTVLLESWNDADARWLPDSRHIVYSVDDMDFNTDVWLMDVADPSTAVNLTRHPDIDTSPRISDDGTFLVFLSDRGRIGHNYEFDVYGMVLDPALLDMTDWAYDDHVEAAGKAVSGKSILPIVDLSDTPEAGEPLTFTDLDTAWRRVFQITSLDDSESDLYLTRDGKRVLFSGDVDGTNALWSTDWRGKGRKQVVAGSVSDLHDLPNGKQLSYVSGGQAKTVAPSGGSAKTRSIDADAQIDLAAEQAQKFAEAARLFGRDFYHPTIKGLDWPALSARYGELAARTRTSQAFNRVVNEMFGEVNGSHTGAWGGFGTPGTGRTSIGYLAVDASPVPGGWQVDRVMPGGPADMTDGLNVGDIIRAVNDVPFTTDDTMLPQTDIGVALKDTAGKETMLAVRSPQGEDRLMLITPISSGALRSLAYLDEVERTRAQVEAASDGRLGYLHIRGMNMPSVHDFERDLYAAAHGKDGLLIDVRDNGGGFTTDILLSSLTAPVHAYTVPRGSDPAHLHPDTYPRDRRLIYAWTRPIAVLCNQNSFSNAEIFSHAIQTTGRGPVIGQETFGGVISTGAHTLIDGTTIRRPFRGWYLPDGTDMESRGAIPDVIVERTPADEVAGVDAQLDAAIKRLLQDIPAHPPVASPKPAS